MTIIAGAEEDLKQYLLRVKLNKIGLCIFVVGMILLGLAYSTQPPIYPILYISLLLIVVGFGLAYFTRVLNQTIQRYGVVLVILAIICYIIFSLGIFKDSFIPIVGVIDLFLMGIGIIVGSTE